VFLLFLFLESTKMTRLYLLCRQSSAARPQAGEPGLVQPPNDGGRRSDARSFFRQFWARNWRMRDRYRHIWIVNIPGKTARDAGFAVVWGAAGSASNWSTPGGFDAASQVSAPVSAQTGKMPISGARRMRWAERLVCWFCYLLH
jgi:hypothetical protein